MSATRAPAQAVVWHDLECGRYSADLSLWAELAERAGGAVLDVGAGTGRVALHLAAAGHEVHALDRDAALLSELARRAEKRGLRVATTTADARALELPGGRFALIAAPMQTVQLLGGPPGRERFLRATREHLAPGGRVACALAHPLEGLEHEAGAGTAPPPDVLVTAGATFVSRPVAVREVPEGWVIERVREVRPRDGRPTAEADSVLLDRLDASGLEREARAAGLEPDERLRVAPTAEHVGSTVVVLRGG